MKNFVTLLKYRGWRKPVGLSLTSALLLVVSFPRLSWEYAAWIALAPLVFAVIGEGVGRLQAFGLGWLTGLVFTFMAENWIAHSMTVYGGMLTAAAYLVALLFASILALFPALFAAALVELRARLGLWALALVPLLWAASEWLRQAVTGVTWNALGVSQYEHYAVARLSQYGGVYLVSWVAAGASAFAVLLLKAGNPQARRAAALVVLQMLLPFTLPLPARLEPPSDPLEPANRLSTPVAVLGVQPNIGLRDAENPEDFSRNFARVRALTAEGIQRVKEQAAQRGDDAKVDLVVWAESPLGLFYDTDPGVKAAVDSDARSSGAYLLMNTVGREGKHYFNSVNIAAPGPPSPIAPLRRYDKIRLVPFGEYVPWKGLLGRFVPAIVGNFTPGSEAVVNVLKLESQREGIAVADGEAPQYQIERETKFIRVGAFICYEAAYPDVVREFVRVGATLLVNVSDDAWFGDTAGPEQHLAHAVMRAIENDRDIVRVTNSGISALITGRGELIDTMPRFVAGTQMWRAEARSGRTFYTLRGDLFARACALIAAAAVGASLVMRIRERRIRQAGSGR